MNITRGIKEFLFNKANRRIFCRFFYRRVSNRFFWFSELKKQFDAAIPEPECVCNKNTTEFSHYPYTGQHRFREHGGFSGNFPPAELNETGDESAPCG
jgi:hypothetical protein